MKIGSHYGEMGEWSKVAPCERAEPKGSEGSNPSFSATFMTNCELVVEKYGS